MRHTQHHIKWFHEEFWREIVDRNGRKGAYSMTRETERGIVEIRPRKGSEIALTFELPEGYTGEPADYTGKAYLVEGNLAALLGAEGETLTFAEGQEAMELWLTGRAIPVGGHVLNAVINRKGQGGTKMDYQFSFASSEPGTAYPGRASTVVSPPSQDYDRFDTLKIDYTGENDIGRMIERVRITRTPKYVDVNGVMTPTYAALTIKAPVITVANDEARYPCESGAGSVQEITWTGDDPEVTVTANSGLSHWIVLEYDRRNGGWAKCTAEVMGDVEKQIDALKDGKVDKVAGKGLSTEDYTTAEKTKLAGVEANANAYTLPNASSTTVGGVKVHADTVVGQNGSPLQTAVNSGRLYALAPYADVDMAGLFMPGEGFEQVYVGLDGQEAQKVDGQFDVAKMGGATASAAGKAGIVPAPAAGDQLKYLRGDGTWDDLRTMMLAAFPETPNPDNGHGVMAYAAQAVATDAAAGIPPYQIRIVITSDGGASTAVLTVKGTVDTIMGGGTTYTLDLKALNGGKALPKNAVVDIYDGVRMVYYDTTVYLSEPIIQKDSYVMLTCDVGDVGMRYRQNPSLVIKALSDRIKALEGN